MIEELKVGLEIHQQLDTGKLFCRCPGILRQDNPDYVIERKLHVVAGESGLIDKAAEFEAGKGKKFFYQGYYNNCCLIELDDEPPREINQEALKFALQISLFLNCEIIPYTQIMRKTVIDGSNTSGFQRTLLIAKNGYLDTEEGRVRIDSIALEEDAARIIEQDDEKSIYRLDRLGIPLIEIATAPDIKSASQGKKVALKLGEILRACKVKRGIGTIRQDVNMSVKAEGKWGKRIEIKGVQEPLLIEKTVELESLRQDKLIKENKSEEEVRKALEDGRTKFLRPLPGADRMYPETDLDLLHISREMINNAKADLPKLKSELKDELGKKGLSEEMMNLILKENKISELKELLEVLENSNLIAKMLVLWPREISVKNEIEKEKVERKFTLDVLETILQAVQSGKIKENDVYNVMEDIVKGRKLEDALKRESIENLEEEILKIIKDKPGLSENAYMGLVMQKFKGKVNGKEVMEIIKKLLK